MAALLIGYACCSTDQQDLTAQHNGLTALGVSPARIYVDHGLTGTNRDRPGLREAMAACREGDTLVVESDLIRLRTREGMKVAKAKGRLRASSPSSTRPGSTSGRPVPGR
jgi:DNA invertase Pin-like site-specific DNA recombinase